MNTETPLNKIKTLLQRLPGIGEKSATRLSYYLINSPVSFVENLALTMIEVRKNIKRCKICFNLTENDYCSICTNYNRDKSIICVVEEPQDLEAIEKTRFYTGSYHVLHGSISPLNGIQPENLTIKELINRVETENIKEIIFATNHNVEGDTTAMYIADLLQQSEVKITKIASGVPAGGDIEYIDQLTLGRALNDRRNIK